jgi:hypothetical protein
MNQPFISNLNKSNTQQNQTRVKKCISLHNTKGQCLQVNLSIHKFVQTGFVVSRPAAAPPRSRGQAQPPQIAFGRNRRYRQLGLLHRELRYPEVYPQKP